jgi:citrate synthase
MRRQLWRAARNLVKQGLRPGYHGDRYPFDQKHGLRGVTVADTKISYIDGENGVLLYRGYRIEELAERSTFMETAFMLLNGHLPKEGELERFERQVVQSRDIPEFIIKGMETFPRDADPMDVLQACVPMLGMADPDLYDEQGGELRKTSV